MRKNMLSWKQERLVTELKSFANALKTLSEFVNKAIVSVENNTNLENSENYPYIRNLITDSISYRNEIESNLLKVTHLLGWSKPLPLFGDTGNKLPQVFITLAQSVDMHTTDQIIFDTPVIRGDYFGKVAFVFVDQKENKAFTTVREVIANYIDVKKDGTETQTLIVPAV